MKKLLLLAVILIILFEGIYLYTNKNSPYISTSNQSLNLPRNQQGSSKAALKVNSNQIITSRLLNNEKITQSNQEIKQNAGEPSVVPANNILKDAPVNTWVKIAEEASGTRDWPLFYFDTISKKFMLHGGEPKGPAHFDTEQFDLDSSKWSNVYPVGSPYKTESGPSDAPNIGFGDNEPGLKADKNGFMRILRGLNPYIRDPGMFYQGTFCPDNGKAFAYFQNGTISYDPKTLQWSDLKVPRFSKGRETWLIYGSIAYDPINKELISIGGTSDEDGGSPGTWTFNFTENTWKKLSPGSTELKELNSQAKLLRLKLAGFTNACRNRFYITESATETKQDLTAVANGLIDQFEKLLIKLNSTTLMVIEANAPKVGAIELVKIIADLKKLSSQLNGDMVSETLLNAQLILDAAERTEHILDTEPCGRAASQSVTCTSSGKVVLFSGCRMDGYIGDTWVYDCKTRTWEQKFPKICPAPRAGHTLAWLPKSKKIILYGAIPFTSPYTVPRQTPTPSLEVWTYDIEANEWKLLLLPTADSPLSVVGAVDLNDNLVVISYNAKNRNARTTWALKVDPSKSIANPANTGVVAGTVSNTFESASSFDKVNKIDKEGVNKIITNLPVNQWTLMPKPLKMSNGHGWGVSPYDPIRHQLLSFGGGHSAAHYTDITHYSILSGTWSWGYGEEYPYYNASFSAMFNQTFKNRPTIPTHVWDSAAFDETSGKAIYCIRGGTWLYDPATREWEYPPTWNTEGGSFANMKSTPKGVVFWGRGDGRVNGDLKLFNNSTKKWDLLPLKGVGIPVAYGDTGGMCYDPKRDCLWLAHFGIQMISYDMKTGVLSYDPATGQPENIYMRGTAYIPEIDMLLNVGRVSGPEGQIGNLAYDIQNKKWIGIQFPCSDNLPRTNEKPYSEINLDLYYDPILKIAIFHSNNMEILLSRIDKASLKTFEAKIVPPKK